MDKQLASALMIVIGAVVGSFLNVVILRTHEGRPFLGGHSECPHCHQALRWWEMVPIISFVFLRGRCQRCRQPLAWQYPLGESLTAVIFLTTFLVFGWTWTLVAAWLVAATMIIVATYDLRWSLIPDAFTASFALAAIIYLILARAPWEAHLLGAAAGAGFFSLQYVLSRRRWVGSGDIFLGAVLGLLLGWRMLGLALFLAYFGGSIIAALLILTKRLSLKQSMPFGPYLVGGTFFVWLWGEHIIEWYFNHALFR